MIFLSRVLGGKRVSDVFSFPTDPSNPSPSSHFYRINEFSGCAPVFPAKRRGGRNGCCSATKAVIARTFVLLSEGCRWRRETRGPRLASPRLAYRRSHKSSPTVFPGGSNAYRVFRVLPPPPSAPRSRVGKKCRKRKEWSGEEWRGGRKKDAGKRRRKKLLAREQRCGLVRAHVRA